MVPAATKFQTKIVLMLRRRGWTLLRRLQPQWSAIPGASRMGEVFELWRDSQGRMLFVHFHDEEVEFYLRATEAAL